MPKEEQFLQNIPPTDFFSLQFYLFLLPLSNGMSKNNVKINPTFINTLHHSSFQRCNGKMQDVTAVQDVQKRKSLDNNRPIISYGF